MALIPLTTLKTYLKITDSSQDSLLTLFLNAADASLKKLIGDVESSEKTEYISVNDITRDLAGNFYLTLNNVNITELNELQGVAYTGVLNTDYWILPPNSRKLKILSIFDFITDITDSSIQIKYTSGYVTATDGYNVPYDLQMALLFMASGLYAQDQGRTVQSYKVGDVSVVFADGNTGSNMSASQQWTSFNNYINAYRIYNL